VIEQLVPVRHLQPALPKAEHTWLFTGPASPFVEPSVEPSVAPPSVGAGGSPLAVPNDVHEIAPRTQLRPIISPCHRMR